MLRGKARQGNSQSSGVHSMPSSLFSLLSHPASSLPIHFTTSTLVLITTHALVAPFILHHRPSPDLIVASHGSRLSCSAWL